MADPNITGYSAALDQSETLDQPAALGHPETPDEPATGDRPDSTGVTDDHGRDSQPSELPSPVPDRGTLAARPKSSLSPSRASDFMTCPLLYRFRTIDKLPERPSIAAVRGSLVHSVLENLFDTPARERSFEAAVLLIGPAWEEMAENNPNQRSLLFGPDENWSRYLANQPLAEFDPAAESRFIGEAEALVKTYFRLEDPEALEPERREAPVSVELDSGLTLRGIVDRVDRAPSGEIRIVDYKTGRSPRKGWEDKALFQMRFYGLIVWRMTGQVPARLQLVYLGNEEILAIDPTEPQLLATQAKIEALWKAIEQARENHSWQPRRSKLCGWCSFQSICPEWGGEPPSLPGQ